MKTTFYVVFNQRGRVGAVRNPPTLNSGEFVVRLRLDVPDQFFNPEIPTVDLTIASRDVIVPAVVVDGEQQPQPNGEAP